MNAHIDQHAAYPLQVADLARIADLSSARLHARFVAECGQTPMDYIRSRRLHRAVELLRDTVLPIGEIASRVGYSSQSAFAAAVLREFGASPGKLRREGGDKDASLATDAYGSPTVYCRSCRRLLRFVYRPCSLMIKDLQ